MGAGVTTIPQGFSGYACAVGEHAHRTVSEGSNARPGHGKLADRYGRIRAGAVAPAQR